VSTALELVQDLRARGIILRADGDLLRYRPASALSGEDVDRLRAAKAEVLALLRADGALDQSAAGGPPLEERRAVLPLAAPDTPIRNLIADSRLCSPAIRAGRPGPRRRPGRVPPAPQEQMRLHASWPRIRCGRRRQYARAWAAQHQQCPSCGALGIYHDPATGETIALDIAALVRFTVGEAGPLVAPETPAAGASGLRDTSGWLVALAGLGARRAGPLSPCSECTAGTCAIYGDRPLCRACADAWGTR
jgi:hypothetical protein